MSLRRIRNLALLLSLLFIAGWVGYGLGQKKLTAPSGLLPAPQVKTVVVNKEPSEEKTIDFSLFWRVWDLVVNKYVDKTKVNAQKMVYGAISGMVGSLNDPYSIFLSPEQNRQSKDDLNGTFEGIGAQLGVKDKKIVVIAPLKNSPAEKSGIKAGDWIVKVDGAETAAWTVPEAVSKIRGPAGTAVNLTVLHPGGSKTVIIAIVRSSITVPSVEWKTVESTTSGRLKKALYLRLSRFGEDTNDDWTHAVGEMTDLLENDNSSLSGLVLDLRNNPGGYLQGAVFVSSEFLPDGTVVEQENYMGQKQVYKVNRRGQLTRIPLVVLVNQGSASASEIVAGTLQARKRAKVVGSQTFGKGSVQEAEELPGGAGLHLTTSKWLLPNGAWINGTGLTPDIKIDNDEANPEKDLQLEKAIDVLGK